MCDAIEIDNKAIKAFLRDNMKVAVMCDVIAEINKSLLVQREKEYKKTVSFLVHTCDGFF